MAATANILHYVDEVSDTKTLTYVNDAIAGIDVDKPFPLRHLEVFSQSLPIVAKYLTDNSLRKIVYLICSNLDFGLVENMTANFVCMVFSEAKGNQTL